MKLLVTGALQNAQSIIPILEEMGHTVFFLQMEKDELPLEYNEVEGVICNGLFLHHSIEKFTALKYIQLTSAGTDRVPVEYISEHGITLNTARGVYSVPMSEFALCGVLQLYKQSKFFYKNQASRSFEKHRGVLELSGKRVGIVGCGSVGSECAKRFSAFDCTVCGFDAFDVNNSQFDEIFNVSELEEKLPSLDIVVLTLPLTDKTYHLFDEKLLACMKQGSVLINIARGAVVDTKALTGALETKLLGAVLDVFENEPLEKESPLWDMENVILTPHNSFVSENNAKRLEKLIIANLH